ncbi:MAG TPA: 3-dehydroquinate synthase, partial [Longimicrobiales bacterium]|nr:3-dehydroquinate synthase [Longimicrobiales bacterium]
MTVELPDVARVTLEVPAREERSELLVGAGVRSAIPDLLRGYAPAHRYAVISDDNVAPLHAEPLVSRLRQAGLAADPFTFPAGEASKNAGTWADLLESLARAGVGRDGCVIAVGGGVTGDLAGFVASTFGRGVPLVQVPTSLLAMIDASIGGKTGIDLAAGKNLAGTFHQPRIVIADPEVLETLPDAELRGGLAEAVKHGAIADGEYLEWMATGAPAILSREAQSLRHLIEVSVRIKAGFVAEDARESGARAALNFGHTVAHGIEAVSGYAVPHGQAVAMGMVVEARL